MSRRRHRSKKPVAENGKTGQLVFFLVTAVLAGIPFIYGKYIEFGIDGPFDSALNVYAAKCITNGQKLGVEVFPSARPATLLVNVIGVSLFGFSEAGPKLIQMLMQITALSLMFYTLRKIYGNIAAAAALILASFYLSCPPFAKFGNVKEQFMIACMIISVCGVMLRHMGKSRWPLIVSGAAMINIYFFKPTGASVIIAIGIYLVLGPVFRIRKWRQFGSDVLILLWGMAIGFVPLVIFYLWQGQLPALLMRIPLVDEIISAVQSVFSSSTQGRAGGGKSAYLAGSREVTVFSTQYAWVVGYYRNFIIPIGLSLLAVFCWIQRLISTFKQRKKTVTEQLQTPIQISRQNNDPKADHFVLLLFVWWILDMIFIWVSPRAYVQYFLPIGASSAMLAAYAVYCCGRKKGYILLIPALWLLLDLIFYCVRATEKFPFLSLSGADQDWGRFAGGVILLAVSAVVFVLMRKRDFIRMRTFLLGMICCVMFFWWNVKNFGEFNKRVQRVSQSKAESWVQIGQHLRERSSPQDRIYVWGWLPGIYVKAQRFSPATRPSYSDMHSDEPDEVKWKISRTVRQLSADPPKYIVDPHKIHFPYYDHPIFDLWPRWQDEKKRVFFMRCHPMQPAVKTKLLRPGDMKKYSELNYRQVEKITYGLLTNPIRKGGPIEHEKARQMARSERQRHENMAPLRNFVMENYRPVLEGSIDIFQHNKMR